MAEEKKKIMIHTASGDHVVDMSDKKPKPKFGVLPVSDYVAAVADPDAQPQAGSVGTVVAALAAASRMTSAGTTPPPRATILTSRCALRATSRTRSCTSCAAASS